MKSRIHEVVVKVRFDKRCTRRAAVEAFRDNVHGTFYPVAYQPTDPETMVITSVKSRCVDRRSLPR